MWGFHDGLGWWMVFGGLWTVAFWAAIIWLVVWLASRSSRGPRERTDSRSPSDIAKERLARGEISIEEFDRIMAKLSEHDRS